MEHPRIDPGNDHEPWQKRPGESEPAYAAFLAFRDAGPARTVLGLGKSLAKTRQLLDGWCQKHHWRARCAAWDAHLQRAADTSKIKRTRQMIEQHGQGAVLLRNLALRAMQPQPLVDKDGFPVLDRNGGAVMKPPTLRDLGGAAAAMSQAIHHERLAAGLPTDVRQQDVVLHDTIATMNGMMADLVAIIESQLCPECRLKIADRIDEIARQRAAIAAEIV